MNHSMFFLYLAEGYTALHINFLDTPRAGPSARVEEEITVVAFTVTPFPARRKLRERERSREGGREGGRKRETDRERG